MLITARGWRRNAGTTVICERDLRDATNRLTLAGGPPRPGVHLAHVSDGIHLQVGPETLTHAGQYQINIHLSPEDVMRVFEKCFPDVANVIKAIHEPSEPDVEAAQ